MKIEINRDTSECNCNTYMYTVRSGKDIKYKILSIVNFSSMELNWFSTSIRGQPHYLSSSFIANHKKLKDAMCAWCK